MPCPTHGVADCYAAILTPFRFIGAKVLAYLGLEDALLLPLGVLAAMTLASFVDAMQRGGQMSDAGVPGG